MKKFSTISLVLLIALAFFACDDKPKQGPHESTITAFGKTAKVKGDASISTADFNKAVENLSNLFSDIEGNISYLNLSEKTQLNNIMDRGITIVPGNAVPTSIGGALTVGVDYLKSNDMQTIGNAIFALMSNNAFAD